MAVMPPDRMEHFLFQVTFHSHGNTSPDILSVLLYKPPLPQDSPAHRKYPGPILEILFHDAPIRLSFWEVQEESPLLHAKQRKSLRHCPLHPEIQQYAFFLSLLLPIARPPITLMYSRNLSCKIKHKKIPRVLFILPN